VFLKEPKVQGAMAPIRGLEDFNLLVRTQIDKHTGLASYNAYGTEILWDRYPDTILFAALLYTDEDTQLAKYVRLNYTSLDKMSGENCAIFVVESPPQMSLAETVSYWKDLLTFNMYILWGSKGWTRTKPYDKAAVYQISTQLGIFPDQLPCVVFFEQPSILEAEGLDKATKIIIPIKGNLPDFFRTLFSSIGEGKKLIDIKSKVETLGTKVNIDEGTIIYKFCGQTVFINRSAGPVQLSNFHNTSADPADGPNKGDEGDD